MNILLLGASGFIGSNILQDLIDLDCNVFAVTRRNKEFIRNNVERANWVSYAELSRDIPGHQIDGIVSVAGVGNPSFFETDPTAALVLERSISEWVCNLAVQFRVPRIVYVSSGGTVYGEGWSGGSGSSFLETDECAPISAYGKCKLLGEQHLTSCVASAGIHCSLSILRASNIYGTLYEKGGRQGLINSTINLALGDQSIVVYGDGNIYRDYLFAADLSASIVRALQTDDGGTYNVAAGISHSILDVIKTVESVLGHPLRIRFEESRSFDIKYSGLSIIKAQQVLGWRPLVGLQSGIEKLVEFYRKQPHIL